ncbi:MAG TPA: NAD synthetase, partial [Gammaproteobacteria bacterium]|nr:NAD synthetase [Gammaproteobacteria bacterium]
MTFLDQFDTSIIVNLTYILASMLFIFGLKMLGSPETAKRGNLVSSSGMFLAVLVTLLDQSIIDFTWIIVGTCVGASIGFLAATKIKMTAMPEMVALFNGFGGIASLLVGSAEYLHGINQNPVLLIAIYLTVLIGGVTFSGSLIAWGKLSETISGNPFLYTGQQIVNSILLVVLLVAG